MKITNEARNTSFEATIQRVNTFINEEVDKAWEELFFDMPIMPDSSISSMKLVLKAALIIGIQNAFRKEMDI